MTIRHLQPTSRLHQLRHRPKTSDGGIAAPAADADAKKQPTCALYATFVIAMLRSCGVGDRARFIGLR